MFTVSREFTFCYGHRLLDYNGKCAHPHGHNAKVLIELQNEALDQDGMVLDFTELKRTIGQWLEDFLDHQMILQDGDPLVPVLREMGEPVFLMSEKPTAENLAKLVFEKSGEFGFPVAAVTFWETEKCCAEYRTD
jgi:6-pyruvoyltetrahydropterin/6-carboxytetrahydropterin synthase